MSLLSMVTGTTRSQTATQGNMDLPLEKFLDPEADYNQRELEAIRHFIRLELEQPNRHRANRIEAMHTAGYSKKSTNTEMFDKPKIKGAVDRYLDYHMKGIGLSSEWLLKRLARDVQSDIRDLFDHNGAMKEIGDWPVEFATGLVNKIKTQEVYEKNEDGDMVNTGRVVEIGFSDRTRLLDMLARHKLVDGYVRQRSLAEIEEHDREEAEQKRKDAPRITTEKALESMLFLVKKKRQEDRQAQQLIEQSVVDEQ